MIIPFRSPADRRDDHEELDPATRRELMDRHPAGRAQAQARAARAEAQGPGSGGRATATLERRAPRPATPPTARTTAPAPTQDRRVAPPRAHEVVDVRNGRVAAAPGRVGSVAMSPGFRSSASAEPRGDRDRPGSSARPAPRAPESRDGGPAGRRSVDPRIAARRDEVERSERRRRNRPMVVLGGLVLVLAIAVAVLFSPVMSVRRIVVVCAAGGDEQSVVAATGLELGTPLVRVDSADVEDRIAALSWVRSASVERTWPDRVTVRVVLRALLAAVPVGGSGALAVLDRDGWVLRTVSGRSVLGDVPVLPAAAIEPTVGSGTVERVRLRPVGTMLLSVLDALDPAVRRRVVAVAADGPAAVVTLGGFGSDATLVVHFGTATDLPVKAAALRSLLGRPELAGGGTADLSMPDAPVIIGSTASAAR